MTSVEVWGIVAGLVSIAGLLFEYLRNRTPSQQVNDQIEAHGNRITALENALAHIKNTP